MAGSAPLKIEIGLPTLGPDVASEGIDIGIAARHAEAMGFDSVSAADLITGDGAPALEVVVTLAAAAAATEHEPCWREPDPRGFVVGG